MKHFRALLLISIALSFGKTFAFSSTPWEKYLAHPGPENAKLVQIIQYSGLTEERQIGEQITADLQILAIQVFSADREAFRLTLRLIRSTKPGANLEDLAEISGRYARLNPRAYLEDVRASGQLKSCPGIDVVGLQYVDRETARTYEINARINALKSVRGNGIEDVRKICISQLAK